MFGTSFGFLNLYSAIKIEAIVSNAESDFDFSEVSDSSTARSDAVSALVVLGYTASEANRAVSAVKENYCFVFDFVFEFKTNPLSGFGTYA